MIGASEGDGRMTPLFKRFLAGWLALGLFGAAIGVGGAPARAATGPWVENDQGSLRLLAARDDAGETADLRLGLHFKLKPGWKIYWRSPGDAGYPPTVDWSGSRNLAQAEIAWPVPHRFSLFGLETFGYGGEVVLPIEARLEAPGAPVAVRAEVEYLVCSEICVPQQAALSLDMGTGPGAPSPDGFLIDTYMERVPGRGAERGLNIESVLLTGTVEAPEIQVTARSERPFDAPDVLVEAPPGFAFVKPTVALSADRRGATLRVPTIVTGEGVLEGKRMTVTVTDGKRGIERPVVARFGAVPAGGGGIARLLGFVGLALIGGLILNLMPCVLPVLSIKLLAVVKQGGRGRAKVRAGFLASAAGIVASFLVLAGAAVALKAAGLSVGWGIQFQQPLFLAAMALMMTLFACSLFGFFTIPLPGWARRLVLAGTAPGGAREGADHGLLAHFLTGALATLMATPCSAPFLGTAVGFALARGPGEILAIFTALGVGLAAPYLVIAAAPSLATRLPRPGPWMIKLRRALGVALAGTALWLVSILAIQVSLPAALGAGGLLTGMGLLLGLRHVTPTRRLATSSLAAILALAAVALPAGMAERPGAAPLATDDRGQATDGLWQPLDIPAIRKLVAEGRVVFVDVTAEWCITCQVNKKLVLDRDQVIERLRDAKA
ncbi:MAG: protein-disulfide reductase DsbD family protein, partial [Kiloniellaceae bacterium]